MLCLAVGQLAGYMSFMLDSNILGKTRDEVGTFGEQLEGIFGWKMWTSKELQLGGLILPLNCWGNRINPKYSC